MDRVSPPTGPSGPKRRTRFVCISDTHNCTVRLPKGDVLVHAGDLTNTGSLSELSKQVAWLEKADFECKLVIAGNHDRTLDADSYDPSAGWHSYRSSPPPDPVACRALLMGSKSLTYLQHEAQTVRLADPRGPQTTFTVFGSPHTPRCGSGGWGFQYDAGSDGEGATARTLWDAIPLDTDVLITHGPARTHLDENRGNAGLADGAPRSGCEALRRAMWRIRPSLAVCGHVHGGRGAECVRWDLGSRFVRHKELEVRTWDDPAPEGNKICLVDLTARGGGVLDNDGARVGTLDVGTGGSSGVTRDGASSPDDSEAWTRGLEGSPRSAWSDSPALLGRMGRKETCLVNCAIQTSGYPHRGLRRLNKPIVVDLELPVWRDESVPVRSSNSMA